MSEFGGGGGGEYHAKRRSNSPVDSPCTYPECALEPLLVEPPDLRQNLEELEDALLLGERRVLFERVLDQLSQVLRLQNTELV